MGWKKFAIGDQVFFDVKTNKHYPVHDGHKGEILSMKVYPKIRYAGTRISYEMECECGSILHPLAEHIHMDFQNWGREKLDTSFNL